MKTEIFTNTIIKQAIELGFDFEQFTNDTTIEEMTDVMFDFFNENSDKLPTIEDECEVSSGQNVNHRDYTSYGEIVDFSAHWSESPETKVFHSDYVTIENGLFHNMRLYYLVGETDYNAPEGYYYNQETKRHEILIEEE